MTRRSEIVSSGALAGMVLAVALVTSGASSLAETTGKEAINAVVDCYDGDLGIVQRTLIGDCAGEIVSPERAEQIRDEMVQRRRRMLANPGKPVISGRKLRSIGSGFFVAPDGRLLTNNHVVDGCAAISVETPDGRKVEARVLDTRPQDDLALIAAPLKPGATATFFATGRLPIGTPITVIGYPDQGLAPITPLLTHGELGESTLLANGRPRFEIRADIRHGNSGGPVVDARALVIGVVYAKVNSVAVFQATGKLVRFVGAVIDNRAVLEFLERNNVPFRSAETGPVLDHATFEARLRELVARVGCWA